MSSIQVSRWRAAAQSAALVLRRAVGGPSAVEATDVNVDTRNPVVRLTGQVANQAEKQLALRIARDTDGVRNVVDQIQVARR